MIVDLEPTGKTRRADRLLMPLAVAALALGLGALVLREPDHASAEAARARILAALPSVPAGAAATVVARPHGPSVLAQRTPAPPLPRPLTLPEAAASAVPMASADARRALLFPESDSSRATVYRVPDGRLLVLQQTTPGRGRPVVGSYGYEEGLVRGLPAQFMTWRGGVLLLWREGPASYYMYSRSLTMRELLRLADLLG